VTPETAMEVTKLQELAYELRVGQAMTSDVITLAPAASMGHFRDVLRDHRISGTPVVANGEMVGIISIEDLIKALANGEMSATVHEKMTQDPVVIYEDEPLVHAVSRFSELSFGRLPVVDRNRKLVGIITQGDIVRSMLKRLEVDYHQEEIHRYRASHIFEDIVADQITLVFSYHVVARDFQRAGEASSGLKTTLRRLGIHPHTVRRVTIATYEAEMNLALWSEGGEIIAEVQPSQIKIEVVDQGPGIADPEQAMQPGFSTAPEWVREMGFGAGMGLPNIQACSDEMELESTVGVGTRLEIVMYQDMEEDDDLGDH
jgi:CBS domain-containing protein/anti-sigma regulatory factor (Ser/Thr protein kinase)